MNQALIQTSDPAVLQRIRALPFVAGDGRMSPRMDAPVPEKRVDKFVAENEEALSIQPRTTNTPLNYGNSYPQIHLHEGDFLHGKGLRGENMLIAVLDAGFQGYKTNPMFDSLRLQNRVLMEWDFINNEASVNEDHPHGMQCLSTLAANRPGVMVGSAPYAQYLLFRTENAAREYPYEEQAWLVAAEKADSAGADMISSSLGYLDFDDPAFNYSYQQRDGNTSLITRAADMAAAKGILVMNSAGNNGNLTNENKFVSCPGDADSVFTVGAVNVSGQIAGFSSWGPAYGGKTKPNAVSVGQGTVVANNAGNAASGNGTSFANPNLAGMVACLWQAFPDCSNMEIIRAVEQSSDRYNAPHERYGYGLPNFKKAHDILARQKEQKNYQQILGKNNIKAYPVPFDDELRVAFKAEADGALQLRLVDLSGKPIDHKQMVVHKEQYYTVEFRGLLKLPAGVYYLQTSDGTQKNMIPVIRR
ncbi:S8 family peptidase [Parasegetibacter sp. NRK P23]|uniref:S8 family peptidase n=1 Tax=Parasegetibacter sp. NRK P23 TaxID=2942999 RepID=UPI0020442646|nr:S8 family peptidase [Parasegetibacter sp. NRK P23]MCM5528043.1 S8 family peptidase [Parasegetibacter sp. NRK P23]